MAICTRMGECSSLSMREGLGLLASSCYKHHSQERAFMNAGAAERRAIARIPASLLVTYAKRVTLITNGIKIVDMKDEMPWELITTRISLNEVHSSNYRLTSGVDRFEKVIAGFEWLRDRGAHVQLKFLVAKHNIDRVPDYLIFAMKYPGVELILGPMSDYTGGKNQKEWERHALFDDDYDAKELMAQHRRLAQSRGVKVLSWPKFIQRKGTPAGGCVWPWQHITIDGAGNVGACCRMISVGSQLQNIHEVGPAAWHAPGLERLREAVGRGGRAMPEECRYCIVR